MIGMLFPELFKQISGCTICKRTAGFKIWKQYFFMWVEYLGCLRHKVNSGKDNDIRFRFFCLLCKAKTISNKISHILYIGFLVIVRQDYCILFFLQSFDLLEKINRWINLQIKKADAPNIFFCYSYVDIFHNN